MNVLYEGYAYRTVDNLRPILDGLARRGHNIGYCVFPHTSVTRNLELGSWPFHRLCFRPVDYTDLRGDLPIDELRNAIIHGVRELGADVVLLDDILNYPSSAVHQIVKEEFPELPVIAIQHGFFQFWGRYRRNFACDRFLVYGQRDRREFRADQQDRVVVFGLPKLSRLADLPTSDDGTVLFVGQDTPHSRIVLPALHEFAQITGRHVRIRPHPQYDTYSDAEGDWLSVEDGSGDILPSLASCHAVITTGSTAGIEAMLLGKPVVSLPSYSSGIYRDSPCVASDHIGQEIVRVLEEWPAKADEAREFLDDAVSPMSFDIEAALDTFEALVSESSSGL